MKIHIHRGQNQLGGNIIEIATDTTKILLDAGLELVGNNEQSLPKIQGLFDYAGYDAIFISHYHGDHVGLAYLTHKDRRERYVNSIIRMCYHRGNSYAS